MVRLEPLVHWGTVGTTLGPHPVLCFRRDGELTQRPEYKAVVDRVVEPEAPMYCVHCLEQLWGKRDEAMQTLRQLRVSLSARAQVARARRQIEPQTDHPGLTPINLPALSWDGTSDAATAPESSGWGLLDSGAPAPAPTTPSWKKFQPGPIERLWSHTLAPKRAGRETTPEDLLLLKPRIAVLPTKLHREDGKSDEELAALGYKAFMESHKTVRDYICICHGPANCFATRQEPSKVAQCAEADCLFTWYHLDCLDSPDKEKAREGTLVCETCREEEEEEEGL